jgi:hypothetical protein
VNVFTKKNALVGFLTLQALSRTKGRRIGRKKRSSWKLPALVALGIVSVGVFAVVAAVMLRRQREPEHLEGYAVAAAHEGPIASLGDETEPGHQAA